jgi:hypothetical protein
MSKVAIWD